MDRKIYPVLIYALPQQIYMGQIPGLEWHSLAPSASDAVQQLSERIQREYRKDGRSPYPAFEKCSLRQISLKITPTEYRDGAMEISKEEFKIPIQYVYGIAETGTKLALIVPTQQTLEYHHESQLGQLVQYLVRTRLEQMSTLQLSKLLTKPLGRLETIAIPVRKRTNSPPHLRPGGEVHTILTRMAEEFPPVHAEQARHLTPQIAWEQDEAIQDIKKAIQQYGDNVLVIGEPGVGKSTVLATALTQLHKQYRRDGKPFKVFRLQGRQMLAEARYLGDWQETADEVVAQARRDDAILWITDILQLMLTHPQEPAIGLGAYLLPYLERGQLRIVGELTPHELEFLQYKLPQFLDVFTRVSLQELSEDKVMRITDQLDQYYKQHYHIRIGRRAQETGYRLLKQYYPYERFPAKIVRLLDRCMREAQQENIKQLSYRKVIDVFAKWTGLPKLFLRDDYQLDKQEIEAFFTQRIIGQPLAVQQLINIVTVFKAGLQNPEKPIKTMLFTGPTGVGKTLTAKALADFFFGYGQKSSPLIALDMSELKHAFQIDRLLGSEDTPGKLVNEVQKHPFSVVLLDEIEKAGQGVLDVLLRVLDEGVLIDRIGREINFRNTIIIMTSNLGATERKTPGFGGDDSQQKYMAAIQQAFRPEFFNRIDDIIVFEALDKAAISQIATLELTQLAKRSGLLDRKIKTVFSESLINFLVQRGYDPLLGARPMQRTVERLVLTPIARLLLDQPELKNCRLRLDYREDRITVDIT